MITFWDYLIIAFELAIDAAIGWLPFYEPMGLTIFVNVYMRDALDLTLPMIGTYVHIASIAGFIVILLIGETIRFALFLYNVVKDQVPGL